MSDDWVVTIASLLLAGVFAWSGFTKILRNERWRAGSDHLSIESPTQGSGIPAPAVDRGGGRGCALGGRGRSGAYPLTLGLLAIFCFAIIRARILLGTDKMGCGCFGGTRFRDYRLLLAKEHHARVARRGGHRFLERAILRTISTLGDSSTLLWLMSALTLCAVAWGLWQASRRMHRQDDT